MNIDHNTTTNGGFSCAKVFDDDVPDDAPADEADAFPIDDVIDCNYFKYKMLLY